MTEIAIPAPHHDLGAPGALSEDALTFLESSASENTVRSYAAGWSHFADWCQDRGLVPLPATPETVANYCAALAECFKISTIRHRVTVINQAHENRDPDTEAPGKSRKVRQVLRGIARNNGASKKKAEPVMTEHLQAIAARLDLEGTPEAKRDKALLLVGFAAALRRSELGAIRFEDLVFEEGQGVKVTISRSKTDQEGEGQAVGIAYGRHASTCPVRAIKSWLEAAGIASGAVFRGFRKGGVLRDGGLSGEAIRTIIRSRVAEVLGGEAAEKFSGHSLRRGFVSQGAKNHATERGMMKQTRHKSVAVFRDYIKDFGVWQDNESATLGL